jgi:hypothetical protein
MPLGTSMAEAPTSLAMFAGLADGMADDMAGMGYGVADDVAGVADNVAGVQMMCRRHADVVFLWQCFYGSVFMAVIYGTDLY